MSRIALPVRTPDMFVSSPFQSSVDRVIHEDKIGKQVAHSCSFRLNPLKTDKAGQKSAGTQFSGRG